LEQRENPVEKIPLRPFEVEGVLHIEEDLVEPTEAMQPEGGETAERTLNNSGPIVRGSVVRMQQSVYTLLTCATELE
jgi:hypothetical protein